MSSVAHRFLAALLLAVWLAPGASALAVGLHLTLDHHEHDGEEHDLALSDLARAAMHGHHHPAVALPGHDHEVTLGRAPVLCPSSNPVADLPFTVCPGPSLAVGSVLAPPPWRGPPLPLFTAHCSLLL